MTSETRIPFTSGKPIGEAPPCVPRPALCAPPRPAALAPSTAPRLTLAHLLAAVYHFGSG